MGVSEFRILGPLEVVGSGGPVALVSAKQRAVLAALILDANQVVSTDRLIEAVWGGSPPPSAAHALQVYVSELRRHLEPGRGPAEPPRLLITRAPGYLLRVGPGQLDSDRFENLTAEGRAHLASGSPEVAADLLDEALALWRGPALGDLAGSEVAEREAARLEELRLTAVEDGIEAGLACGHHVELVAELQAMVAAQPFRERAWAQLLLALYRAGRQGHALEAYRALRRLLDDELGVVPGAAVQDLHRLILRQHPQLEWTPRATNPYLAAVKPVELPETRYVHAGVNLAYQAFGQGAVDLVFLPGYFSHLEVRWEEPRLASLYRRIAAWSRLIMIDRRGSGLSDRTAELPAPQQQMDDVVAVMDALGSRRAVLFGVSDGGVLSLQLAAADPGRVAGVITYAAYPAFAPAMAADCGHSEEFLTLLAQTAGQRFVLDLPLLDQIVQVMAPSRAEDDRFVRWLGRYSRLSAGPGATAAAFAAMRSIDIRQVLPDVQAPTLVLHRRGDRVLPPANGRYLAEHLRNAGHVELAGDDHIIWAGDVDVIAHEVERFVAALPA